MFSKTKTAFPTAIAIRTGVSTMNWGLFRTVRLSCWSQVKRYLAEWRLRARSRRELINLNDWILRDNRRLTLRGSVRSVQTVFDGMTCRCRRGALP